MIQKLPASISTCNSSFSFSPSLETLILIITNRCNLNCHYCQGVKRNNFIKKEIVFRAIDLYLNRSVSLPGRIKICGGEPFLEIGLLREIVSYIRKRNSDTEIEITTNGIFLNKTVLNWVKENKIRLSLSLDGDEKSQLLNRKGITPQIYKKTVQFIKQSPLQVIINMVIAPNNVERFFQNFLYLYNLGVRKFNFLPAAYAFCWSSLKLKLLENQFAIIFSFLLQHPDIYIKNVDVDKEIPLFNFGITVDCNGDIFPSDLIITKYFQSHKRKLKLGNVIKITSFDNLDFLRKKEKSKPIIQKVIPPRIIKSNQNLDKKLHAFVEKIKLAKIKRTKRVDIKIGYQCNNRCLFCVQGDKRKKCTFMDTGKVRKELIEATKTCGSIVFTGGEPTLHPHFLDLVGFAKELDFHTIQIQTNTRMFAYKSFCQETIKAGANEFSPAIHGHTPALHDYLTTVPGSFKQTIQGIKNLKELGQKIITNTVNNKFNYHYLPKIAQLLVSLNVDQFQFAFVHIVGSAWKNRNFIVPKKSQIMPYVKKGLDIGIKAGKRVMVEAIPYCFMQGYEQCIAESIIPEAMVIENEFKIKDYKEYRLNQGKIKGPECINCLYFSICEGPWREYPEIFGWDEFKPIPKKV